MAASSEERIAEPAKELAHKTKVIQFLGRTTPIILQNDNGPCPLLAICNVLLLKNNLNLSPDIAEVSQEKLLSLVAERLIDSNSNVDNKDAGYVENQQQNISDAIDLLPRLTTGIDVNIKFRRIDDFEFTRECAIFDLLDIPLYHGWIVDSQVNGNTLFMTGNFKEFKVKNQASTTWDEQNAMATTADYLASIDNPAQEDISFSSDLQLAIALQQQEFEQQPQRNSQQPTVGGGSRLVTGPQVSRSSGNLPSPSKPDSKASKDKCVVM